jgi:hypothetical protein
MHVASAATNIGWVLADQPNATKAYAANPAYSYNSFGKTITVTPEAVGAYGVNFGGLVNANDTNIQVSAYNTAGYCMYWGAGGGPTFNVACFDASGNFANTEFSLLLQRRSGNAGNTNHAFAFLFASERTNSSYTPSPQYNSLGRTDTVTRTSAGSYAVLLPGLTKTGGQFQVTTFYSILKSAPCSITSWSSSSSGASVEVNCFSLNGSPLDEEFSLAYSIGDPLGFYGIGSPYGAYALADQPESSKPYPTPAAYSYNGFGTGALKAQKTGAGTYSVTIPGTIGYSRSLALVTAVGNSSAYCNLAGWTHQVINVACFAQAGVPADSEFAVTFQTAP